KGLLAVPTYGPASADGITKVQICTTASPCNIPGGSPETGPACELTSCKVEVAIYFSAVQKSVPVAYTMKFFDRCSGQTIDLPGTATTTPATGYIVAIPTDHLTVNIPGGARSEEHTSELQSRVDLVCRLLLEKKKNTTQIERWRAHELRPKTLATS